MEHGRCSENASGETLVPELSVVVPAYRAHATLDRCVGSLLGQHCARRFEIIVVASADTPGELPRIDPDPRLRVVHRVPRLSAAEARNLGASLAQGRYIAFTDADVVVEPGWLDRLMDASAGHLCAAGSVLNGTPESATGTVDYLVSLLDLNPARPPATAWHGGCGNLLLPITLWERYGPFPEGMGGGEDTLLTVRMRADGFFVFAADAAVTHLNRTGLKAVLKHNYEAGRFSAHVARRGHYKCGFLVRTTSLAPIAALGRMVSLYVRLGSWGRSLLPRAVVMAPLVWLALGAWGLGLALEGREIDRAGRARPWGRPRTVRDVTPEALARSGYGYHRAASPLPASG